MTKIYDASGKLISGFGKVSDQTEDTKTLAKAFGARHDGTVHGRSPADIEKFAARGEQMLGGVYNPQMIRRSAVEDLLPEGRTLNPFKRTSQMTSSVPGLSGGSGTGRSFFTTQTPFQPEFSSPDRQFFPIHRRLANSYWRLFAKMDPVIGAVIEMLSSLPFSDVQFTGEGVDGEVREGFEYAWKECRMQTILPYLITEFLTTGEAIPHLYFDDSKGAWTYCAIHNPDDINVVHSPFIHMDPILEFVPDQKLRSIVQSENPMLARVRETMPPQLVASLMAGENITLSPLHCTFIPRKLHHYDLRGTSIITRLWRTLMFEDALWSAAIATARRAATPLKVAKLGDATSGTIPSPTEEQRVLQLLAQAEMDPQCFTPETPVVMADTTLRPIGEIKIGDRLLDRNGAECEVAGSRQEQTDTLIRLEVAGGAESFFECTPNHKWPVYGHPRRCFCGCGTKITSGNFKNGGHGMKRHVEYWRPSTAPVKHNEVKFRFPIGFDPNQTVRADEIRANDYLKLSRFCSEIDTDVTPDKARLLGYYIAEGSTWNVYTRADASVRLGVCLSFGYHEEGTLAADAKAIVESLVDESGCKLYARKHASTASVQLFRNSTVELAQWLATNGGRYAKEKRISSDVMRWPRALKKELLIGMLRGDGNVGGRVKSRQSTEFNTASLQLAHQIQRIIVELGSYAPVYKHANDQGFGKPGGVIYKVVVHGHLSDELLEAAWDDEAQTAREGRAPTSWWSDNEYVYVPVTKVERLELTEPRTVINLAVSGDHSYQVRNVGTFNSWFVYNYQIGFDLIGNADRLMSINTHYDLVERLKLTALGVSKSFISGESSYASSAAGLTIFLQRLKSLRDFIVNEWVIPKFFLPMSVANGWIKPSKAAASGGNVRIKRSSAELQDENMYILPTLEWAKSLDPTIDSERISAMTSLETQLGIKISEQKKYGAIGLDPEEEQKQIVEETKFKRDLAGDDPTLQVALGLAGPGGDAGGGGGGGGGMLGLGGTMSPAIPPEAFGAPGEDGGGAPPMDGAPGGDIPPTPSDAPSPEGAELHADKGSAPKPADKPDLKETSSWSVESLKPLHEAFKTFDASVLADDDLWRHALKDKDVKDALKAEDATSLWQAVEQFLIDENYPTAVIGEVEDSLAAAKLVSRRSLFAESDLAAMAAGLGVDLDDENFSIVGAAKK